MKKISVLLFLCAVLLFGTSLPAPAQNDSPACHGANEEPCREDPNPDRGMDCERSDDHRGCVTTTTATTTGETVVITPAPVTEVQGATETRPETLPRTGTGIVFLVLFAAGAAGLGGAFRSLGRQE